ncbi:SusD/RagB family nutrient-binding outer membrane lipoprotein [Aquiflexum sp. TKW24L]|uniref:SusD/RagB family nutrient-binding outer membrane lipoprotein n=1 Tax=Aquiflexum sp. TKW24L TaxID=2942212 RepID=UPI0020C05C31|nr:SusD/RagB family nutrient-binding outer membrane lipoprotein [Aquiflexum sp. TKW24L]MCL6260996.1 SusD/RagB family nutrient-binding outer membrane lipoprotein [Aquiflexum sp. TKW24L]
MKSKNNILNKGLALFLGMTVFSCDLQDANINPNAVSDAPVNVTLPATQANMTWAIGDFAAQSASTLVQYMTGTLNVQQNITIYSYVPANFQATWNNHFYAGALTDLKRIIAKSEVNGSTHYRAVAKIQTALLLGNLVDLWGDVPFSEALNPVEFPQPKFDGGQAVYTQIFSLLDEAIADLNASSTFSPSNNDLIYPAANENAWRTNSIPKWIKAANSLKARYANHLSKVDPQGSANNVLAAINAGAFLNNADDFKVIFGTTPDAAGPWFGFLQGTFGQNNIAVCEVFVRKLRDRVAVGVHDPRLPFYVAPNSNGQFVGAPYGSPSIPAGTSRPGPYVFSPGAPTNFMTYAELKFIEAEARIRLGQFDLAAAAYNAAVKASVLRVTGSANPAFEAIYASETGASLQAGGLEKLFNEKHIDMYLQTESWVDWRRSIPAGAAPTVSGTPQISPAPNNLTNGAFPRRFLYPPSELDNNASNIPETSLLARVFWDL